MKTLLKAWIEKYRIYAHILLTLLLLTVIADGMLMNRSIEHMLIGHTALVFFILVGILLVEAAAYACRCLECDSQCNPDCRIRRQ